MDNHFLLFFHSLLRYGVLITIAWAGFAHLRGFLMNKPILNGDRALAIAAVIFSHTQLVIGLILYLLNFQTYANMGGSLGRFWKMEHIGTMVIAVVLVTMGRVLSKKAKEERIKQKRVAIFYLIALVLILWAIPWPSHELSSPGHGRNWI